MKAFLIAAWLLAVASVSYSQEVPEWKLIEGDSILVQYPEEMEHIVEPLHSWLDATLTVRGYSREAGLFPYRDHVDEIAQIIATRLSLEDRHESIKASLLVFCEEMEVEMQRFPDPRLIQLWVEEKLKAYQADGGTMPGFALNTLSRSIERVPVEEGELPYYPVPIAEGTKADQFEQAKERIRPMFDAGQPVLLSGVTGRFVNWLAMHIEDEFHLTGAYRRWFVIGVANALMLETLHQFYLPEVAMRLQKEYDPVPYRRRIETVQLGDWLASEYLASEPSHEMERLRTVFAVGEIHTLLERNGDDALPKIMQALRQDDSRPFRDIGSVIRAIHTVTGEDFREELRLYGSAQP